MKFFRLRISLWVLSFFSRRNIEETNPIVDPFIGVIAPQFFRRVNFFPEKDLLRFWVKVFSFRIFRYCSLMFRGLEYHVDVFHWIISVFGLVVGFICSLNWRMRLVLSISVTWPIQKSLSLPRVMIMSCFLLFFYTYV